MLSRNWKIFLGGFISILVVSFATTYFLRFYQRGAVQRSEPESVIVKLGKHIILPTSTPTIGTVTDVEKLKQKSSFFRDAKNGDKVLIYPDKAIIYDLAQDKIINVGVIPSPKEKISTQESTLK
ncbi:MAG: hypothetical protein U0525_01460 [Patescibacteria group bacterium]